MLSSYSSKAKVVHVCKRINNRTVSRIPKDRQFVVIYTVQDCRVPVSKKHLLQTVYVLGIKHKLRYKMQTKHYGLDLL